MSDINLLSKSEIHMDIITQQDLWRKHFQEYESNKKCFRRFQIVSLTIVATMIILFLIFVFFVLFK